MLLKNYKVKRKFKEDIEPEEILLDSRRLKISPEAEREKIEKPIKERVLKLFFAFIIILLLLLIVKTFQLQIIKGDYWRELADENRICSYPIKPLRGIIYDRNKIPLAINVPKLDLVVVPADLAKLDGFEDIKEKIKDIVGLTYPVIVEENLDLEQALLLESKYANVPGISIRKDSYREYKDGVVFSHVLGYLGKVNKEEAAKENYFFDDYIGRDGLEKVYENILRGSYGEQLIEIDSSGLSQKVLAIKEAVLGQDLILSIDSGLQKKLYSALKARGKRGAAIALNPQNGKVLALVSIPSFNNNDFIRGLSEEQFKNIFQNQDKPLFNRAIAGGYPSGSIIKPLIAAAALEEKIIDSKKQIYCKGQLTLVDKYNPNVFWTFSDWKEHGETDIYKAIAESCNVYFYTIGGGYGNIEGLGIDKIKKYLTLFGWGRILGIDLPGEKEGLIPDSQWKQQTKEENWYIGDTYNVSIGQGDLMVSPLQIAVAISAIANNGRVFQPQLLDSQKPKILNKNFIKQEFLEVARQGMRQAVIYGSAQALYDLPVEFAGKTGTAQAGENKMPHAWFAGFGPYENPEIVIVVLIENEGGGATIAVPVAKEVLSWYFSRP